MPYHGTAHSNRGDPGFGSILKGALKFGSKVLGFSPAGAAIDVISSRRSSGRRTIAAPGGSFPGGSRARANQVFAREIRTQPPFGRKKRRRMNPGNTKALTRASRRIDSFVKVAKKALKHTNYKIVSKSAGRSKHKHVVRHR